MTTADVPADGEVQIGAIRLPAGRRIHSNGERGEPVAWATIEPMPDAGRVWAALSEAHARSGLVPFLRVRGVDQAISAYVLNVAIGHHLAAFLA